MLPPLRLINLQQFLLRLSLWSRWVELNVERRHLGLLDIINSQVFVLLCKLDCMLPHSILQLILALQFLGGGFVFLDFLPKICKEVVDLGLSLVVLLLYDALVF